VFSLRVTPLPVVTVVGYGLGNGPKLNQSCKTFHGAFPTPGTGCRRQPSGVRIATYKTADNQLWAVAHRPGGAHVAVLRPGNVIEVLLC
jgi:hypothetical protein